MQTNPAVEQNKNPWNQSGRLLLFTYRHLHWYQNWWPSVM